MKTKVELIREVTRRLLISLSVLIGLSLGLFFLFKVLGAPVSVWAIAMVFGTCGGFISVQRRLKNFAEEDLDLLASSWPFVFLSPFTGGVLATILYLLFVSGLLAGDLFPRFDPGETAAKDFTRLLEITAHDFTDYAKLMFWAFVGGFSESFVTNIIGSFADSAKSRSL